MSKILRRRSESPRLRRTQRTTGALSVAALAAGALVGTTAATLAPSGAASAATAPCTVTQTILGGVDDSFSTGNGEELANPTPQHLQYWQDGHPAGPSLPFKNYDTPEDNTFFAETFEIEVAPGTQICGAELEFATRGIGGGDTGNDSVGAHFIGPDATRRLGAAVLQASVGDFSPTFSGVLDLGNFADDIEQYESLDVWINDDHEIDFLKLEISTSPLITIEKTTNGSDEAQVPVGGAVIWTYTITNHSDQPAVVSQLVDDREGPIDLDSCGGNVIEPGESMECTLSGYANTTDYCNEATVVGVIEGHGEFEESDGSCYGLIENECRRDNLITNPKFDIVEGDPVATTDEDISVAVGWGPIWTPGGSASTGDLFAENESNAIGSLSEPTPATGNYGGFWTNSQASADLAFREGIMNQLADPLLPSTGSTVLSFTTASMLSGTAEMGIYGVYHNADPLGTTPSTPTSPLNVDLFGNADGSKNVVLLGTVEFDGSEDHKKVLRQVLIDTDDVRRPVDRIFLTHADDVNAGKAFVGVDDFCMPVPEPVERPCRANHITNPGFEEVTGNATLGGHEQIPLAAGWGPIWERPANGSTGDLYQPGFLIPSADPIPETGNFGAFWADGRTSPSTLFREGIMNELVTPMQPDTGMSKLTFGTTQIFPDNATIAVYGVYAGANSLATIVNGSTPTNADLFNGAVVELGTFEMFSVERNHRIGQKVPVDTALFEEPIDRIFLTRADSATTAGRAFVTVDNFCLPRASRSAVETLAQPERLMDTRANGQTLDGLAQQEGRLGSAENNPFGNNVYRLDMAGRAGIERDAKAVTLNVTAVAPDGAGFLSVFPCNGDVPTRPNSSSLNFGAGAGAVANNVTVGLDDQGDVCIYTSVESHILVDGDGYFALESGFETAEPERFVDTRNTARPENLVDGGATAGGKIRAGGELSFDIGGLGAVPSDASAVTLNVAAVRSSANGFLTFYPCGGSRPLASSLNFAAGTNVANGVLVGLSEGDGQICVYSSVETDVLIDVGGYYPAGAGFEPVAPARYLDTRSGSTPRTFDGESSGEGLVDGGRSFDVRIRGRGEIPDDAVAAAINVTAIRPNMDAAAGFAGNGFVSITPGECTGSGAPDTSNLNVSQGDLVRANGAVVSLAESDSVCVYTSRDAHLLLDVTGYFPG